MGVRIGTLVAAVALALPATGAAATVVAKPPASEAEGAYTAFPQLAPDRLVLYGSPVGFDPQEAESRYQLVSRRFDGSGAPVGKPVLVAAAGRTGSAYAPRVVQDVRTGHYLVVWWSTGIHRDGDGAVRALRLDSKGRPLGRSVRLSPAGLEPRPAIAFEPRSRRYAVVWEGARGAVDMRVLDARGRPLGGVIRVAGVRPFISSDIVVAASPATRSFVVALVRGEDDDVLETHQIGPTGAPLRPRATKPFEPRAVDLHVDDLDMALDTERDRFALARTQVHGYRGGITWNELVVSRLRSDGRPEGGEIELSAHLDDQGEHRDVRIAYDDRSDTFHAIWAEFEAGSSAICSSTSIGRRTVAGAWRRGPAQAGAAFDNENPRGPSGFTGGGGECFPELFAPDQVAAPGSGSWHIVWASPPYVLGKLIGP